MPATPSTRWGFQRPADGDQINTWPASMRATIDAIDAIVAGMDLSDPRPAAGVAGRFHRHPATGVVSLDTGSGWVEMARLPHAAAHVEGGVDPVAGQVPIGGQILYAGGVLPSGTEWAWADGSLIDRTVYATFFARVGHNYNGGVDPGSNKVRLPDKRGRVPMGADNFGAGAAGRIAVASAARGQNGGEERHTLTAAELAAHSHPASAGNDSPDHSHSGGTDTQGAHAHTMGNGDYILGKSDQSAGGFFAASGGGGTLSVAWYGFTNTLGSHAHNYTTNGANQRHSHAITVNNQTGGGGAHQNLQPYEVDTYLVRIA